MRLDRFWIGEYKNLKDVTIDFDENHWVTVVIGWNGTGKSNVLEALAVLFRDLFMGRPPYYTYKLVYQIRNEWVLIDAAPDRKNKYLIYRGNAPCKKPEGDFCLTEQQIIRKKDWDNCLPKLVFGYYSGTSERLYRHFYPYLDSYYGRMIKAKEDEPDEPMRMFYALPIYSQFVLLGFALSLHDEEVSSFLDKYLLLDKDSIDHVLFVLKEPPWDRTKDAELFWGASGKVRPFLDKLHSISLAPIRIKRKIAIRLRSRETRGFRYLYIKDIEALKRLLSQKNTYDLFQDFNRTYISEIIEEIRIRVKLKKGSKPVTFQELSEGEQQLLTVLGLLKFTGKEESLFLLDEPDTHLNPKWSVGYLKLLSKFVGTSDNGQRSSHIVLTTHNPLSIADLEKERVQILIRDTDSMKIDVVRPDVHPRGMGYSGLVTSDMFGLAAAIDDTTLELLENKRRLSNKDGPLTVEEKKNLEEINMQLEGYGFRYEARDPVFAEYLRLRYQQETKAGKKLSELPRQQRLEVARKLIDKALESTSEDTE